MSDATTAGRLAGKIALITGAAGNIGEIITRRYLDEGATVVLMDLSDERLNAFRERLIQEEGRSPEQIMTVPVDGSNIGQVRAGVNQAVERFGRVDILVNNAGSPGARQRLPDIPLNREDLRDGDTETMSDAVGNLLGITWNFVRAAAPHMPPGSSIINVSTIFSRTDYYGRIPYVVPKAATNPLTQRLALGLGARGIRVNNIYPGPIDSRRIRTVFQSMDKLKGVPEGTTAEDFFGIMRLSRAEGDSELVKTFPKPLDVANTMVFLGSDESAAFSGHPFEVTNGMDVPTESYTVFESRPELRTVDATGQMVLICAGEQVEDALTLTGALRSTGYEVAIGFRSQAAISQVQEVLQQSRQMQGPSYVPPLLTYLNPLDPGSVEATLNDVQDQTGTIHSAVILPARGADYVYPSLADIDDETVKQFQDEEIVGMVALASQLSRFWEQRITPVQPRIVFLSNGDDGRDNVYADIIRAAAEQLIRVWRHESALDVAKAQAQQDGETPALGQSRPIWANQIVRYVNNEDESLEFACAWAARLLSGDRQIEEINLYLPKNIEVTTGALRPSFGWAESILGMHLGKVALITGGSAGIGGQIGRLLALSGAHVLLAARGAGQLEQLRERIVRELHEVGYANPKSRVQYLAGVDVADEGELTRLVEYTLETFGHVDYLINNAGIAGMEEMVIDMPLDGWKRTLNANLLSNFSLIRKLVPLMKKQGSGYILNVSSYFGGEKYVAVPYPNRSDYAVSKAGQRAMAEAFAHFMGPEVQINALAPGPVEGDRLRGTGERPGLFARRARLIMENKRLNEVHAALIEAHRETGQPVREFLQVMFSNGVQALGYASQLPDPLRRLAVSIWEQGDPQASSRSYLLNSSIAQKLIQRLEVGGHLDHGEGAALLADVPEPPVPFFTRPQIEREARKVRDGIIGMLHLQRMPTEFDVAMATVYYLADRNVSGETFHPSGGLRFERTVTEGELFGKAGQHRLEKLRGSTVFVVGEHLRRHLVALIRTYLEEYDAKRVVLITETEAAARSITEELAEHSSSDRLCTVVANGNVEAAIDQARKQYGNPGPVVCTPFRPLPTRPLIGSVGGDWTGVLDAADFADVVEHQITHHFRVTKKVSLLDSAQLVLVTSETSARSTAEEFALANFIKTTLHAFTATAGVESERTVHRVPVNQVDLTRRARAEEPRNAAEEAEELRRFVDAVILTTAPLPEPGESRYRGRIYRGNAIIV
jgi:malonyl-CoA reductase / 3-hydroxypropionate dehydrogenase (NADP+)